MSDQVQPPVDPAEQLAAKAIRHALGRFHDTFRGIARRAGQRFKQRDWSGLHDDARQRLDVRENVLRELLEEIRSRLAGRFQSRHTWAGIKCAYAKMITDRDDWEIAETFFNSVTRRIFVTVGVDPEIEFVHTETPVPPIPSRETVYRAYEAESLVELTEKVLADHSGLYSSESALKRDAKRVAAYIEAELENRLESPAEATAEFAKVVFYRGDRAFLVGRTRQQSQTVPLVFCLTHGEAGPQVDAVLMDQDDISHLFSFTRSYFVVELWRPYDMVAFINSLIPNKRVAEIYISLGYTKHGKTELYRNARRNITRTKDKYQLAEGQRGMVMIVFTLPSFPVVIKVIRDSFEYPKDCTRSSVIDRYHLIFNHDRAGRLVDAQEYEYLVLDRSRIEPALLEEFRNKASQTIAIEDERVVIKHCYAERRIVPLDVYLRKESDELAQRAVIDYGNAIRDLALTNLFPGDLLTKNFGVTRGGRVVFYDYDEVCLVTECNFRKIPVSDHFDDEMSAEPWYGVGPSDVFPEEFINFLGLRRDLRELFLERHGALLTADFWNDLKDRITAGELFHVAPYSPEKRLEHHVV